MEYKLLSEVSVYRKDRIGSDKVNKENYISTENMLSNRGGVENATTVASAKSFPLIKKEIFCYLILDLTSKKYGMQLKKVAVPMMYWL